MKAQWRFLVVGAASVVWLSACSSGGEVAYDDGTPQVTDGMVEVEDQDDLSVVEQYESGRLSFRDPADDGYEPVEVPDDGPIENPDADPVIGTIVGPDEVETPAPLAQSERVSDELLSSVEPLDANLETIDSGDLNDGKPRNEAGALLLLDPDAAVACGNVEIAITSLDQKDSKGAAEHLTAAVNFARSSETIGMDSWSEVLDGPNPSSERLLGFLRACVEGGYEL